MYIVTMISLIFREGTEQDVLAGQGRCLSLEAASPDRRA